MEGITSARLTITITVLGDAHVQISVFPTERNVTLSKYTIDKYEVTVKLWDEVYFWAKVSGYTFEFDGDGHEDNPPPENHPITNVSWRDCIV